MKKSKLPKTDSVRKLAEFWDTHDLIDFEDELQDVADPVFMHGARASRAAGIKVGASAGGLEAFTQRLKRLPVDTGMG